MNVNVWRYESVFAQASFQFYGHLLRLFEEGRLVEVGYIPLTGAFARAMGGTA